MSFRISSKTDIKKGLEMSNIYFNQGIKFVDEEGNFSYGCWGYDDEEGNFIPVDDFDVDPNEINPL
jgi:hypothetical protein